MLVVAKDRLNPGDGAKNACCWSRHAGGRLIQIIGQTNLGICEPGLGLVHEG